MRLAIVGFGTGAAWQGFARAGFALAWGQEVDGVARRIQAANGLQTHFRVPLHRQPVEAMVFLGAAFGPAESALVLADRPRTVLVLAPGARPPKGYDSLKLEINPARFFSAHAKTLSVCFMVRADLHPDAPPFEKVLQRLAGAARATCRGMRDLCPDLSEFVLLGARRAAGRQVFKTIHPCPEVHSRSLQPRTAAHPLDPPVAAPVAAPAPSLEQLLRVLNMGGIQKPDSVPPGSFLLWCAKGPDGALAELLGRCLLDLDAPTGGRARRRTVHEQCFFYK